MIPLGNSEHQAEGREFQYEILRNILRDWKLFIWNKFKFSVQYTEKLAGSLVDILSINNFGKW